MTDHGLGGDRLVDESTIFMHSSPAESIILSLECHRWRPYVEVNRQNTSRSTPGTLPRHIRPPTTITSILPAKL
ncbi:Uncharacterized protein HZ326_17760 [Fusarium oxysporum f. sp. albedinis]|nr:Uncharacterized protein HZ326_17760 [Fusarium oxysporum f. sp. albedinis]